MSTAGNSSGLLAWLCAASLPFKITYVAPRSFGAATFIKFDVRHGSKPWSSVCLKTKMRAMRIE
jgi:hypothetical protein